MQFKIENIKCGGCSNTIITKLQEVDGVKNVLVDIDDKLVTVITESPNDTNIRQTLCKKLTRLGYPETGAIGSNRFMTKATSYVSCVLGKVSGKS
jgi:copper chaperone